MNKQEFNGVRKDHDGWCCYKPKYWGQVGGKDKKEGGNELQEPREGGSVQGRTFVGTQSIVEATNTSRRGSGGGGRGAGAEKRERPEAGTGPVNGANSQGDCQGVPTCSSICLLGF